MQLSAQTILRFIEPAIYGRRGRRVTLALLLLATALLLWQAVLLRPDAGFEKSLPLEHPYMKVFRQYQAEFGGANTVLVALVRKDGGDIYEERYLSTLRAATEEVFFTPGIDRTRVSSIFTRDVRYVEVVDGGFVAGDVIPASYAPSPEMFAQIRTNVGKAGVVGRLVTRDQRGAMIYSEVLELDPVSSRHTDFVHVAHDLEDKVRGRFTSDRKWVYRVKELQPPFAAGEIVAESFHEPGWAYRFGGIDGTHKGADGELVRAHFEGSQLAVEEIANPQFNPDIDVHIIGFTKVVGDVSDAVGEVAGFFALTILGTMLALWWYLGSLRLAWLPLACSLVAVVWEFGLLHAFGYGLDPFAIMVPFLVLAVSTSHGVQYVNTWADEVVHGRDGFGASRETFRRLFIPGSIALLTNVAGFLTIWLVPIGTIREMSINACLGMFAVIATNKLLMPIWLSYLRTADVSAFRERRLKRLHAGDRLWRALSVVTEKPVAALLVAMSLVVLAVSWWYQDRRIVGDAQEGVPELTPASVYNRDVGAITRNFAIGTDVLKIIAEADPESCIHYEVLDQLSRFTWRMDNTPGIGLAKSFSDAARASYTGLWELNPKFEVLPRNQNVLVLINRAISTSSGLLNFDCSAMPVFMFTTDHKAATIAGIVEAVKRFGADNAREYFETHRDVGPVYCDAKTLLRRESGSAKRTMEDRAALLRGRGLTEDALLADNGLQSLTQAWRQAAARLAAQDRVCPVHFAIASGNVGVMAATNEVVHDKELATVLWVYAVIVLLVWVSYRSIAGLLAICVPLLMVSIFANALMAFFGIGLKVATLPVVTLAVGIGVDYGIYIYDLIQRKVGEGLALREAYFQTLQQTGKAVIFTGLCLAGGVATWLYSDLQFQRDMGQLLVFMFSANMLGAVLLCPAYCRFLMKNNSS
ncbi:MAG TPA: efflux RND transporter permease subunit [Solimonas sp.]|nr:efflux RND transporter permease subunit [Solimonas sp.]